MSIKIEIDCCGGSEKYKGECLRWRCPNYRDAASKVGANWPRMPTGFGNAYGEPRHEDYLAKVLREKGFRLGKRRPGEGNPI